MSHTAISVSSVQLWNEFRANEVKAKHGYVFKVLKVSGIIKSISSGQDGTSDVTLESVDPTQTDSVKRILSSLDVVRCNFNSDEINDILHLRSNDSTTIIGLCSGLAYHRIEMINCFLAK